MSWPKPRGSHRKICRGQTVYSTVCLPAETDLKVREYQIAKGLKTKSEALRELIEKGVNAECQEQ